MGSMCCFKTVKGKFFVGQIQNVELKANNMFRFPLIVCVSLICGITAKPYKPWNKLTDEAFQDTVMSFDGKGNMPLGVQVEPPENTDETDYEIEHSMMIWKSMKGSGQGKQPLKAEEDLDELDHPSVADRLKVQIQNLDANMKYNQYPEVDEGHIDQTGFGKVAYHEPEQDWDDVYHKFREELAGYLAPLAAEYKADAEVRVAHSEPEEDEDEMYHRDAPDSPVQIELLSHELVKMGVRVHLQPEEDMDDLYHKDVLELSPYQDDTKAAYIPSQKRHTAPEADLDDLWH